MAKNRPKVPLTLQYQVERNPLTTQTNLIDEPFLQNGRVPHGRLTWKTSAWRGFDCDVHAWFIRDYVPDTSPFFLDTCFLTGWQLNDRFWDSLLMKRIVLTPGIWEELQPWIKEPRRNAYMRDAILANHPSITVLDRDSDRPSLRSLIPSFLYYEWLLGHRKRYGWHILNAFEKKHGRKPTTEEFQKEAQGIAGEPGFRLMLKALGKRGDPNIYNDEQLVVEAVFHGLVYGVESHVLTRDSDVYDQFFRLLRFMDIHYLSMLFADSFASWPGSLKVRPLPLTTPELNHYFMGSGNLLVEKPDDYLGMILPRSHVMNSLYCLLFAGDGRDAKYASLAYSAERNMLRLLRVKAATGGLNTDRLDGRNCHITGFPKGVADPRRWVIIGDDRRRDEYYFSPPEIDFRHAVNHDSPYETIQYVLKNGDPQQASISEELLALYLAKQGGGSE